MRAEELYELWTNALGKQNVSVDEFEELEDTDQLAWSDMAERVRHANGPLVPEDITGIENLFETCGVKTVWYNPGRGSEVKQYLGMEGRMRIGQIAIAEVVKLLHDMEMVSFIGNKDYFHDIIENLMLFNIDKSGDVDVIYWPNISKPF